jgi:hypothetical protein
MILDEKVVIPMSHNYLKKIAVIGVPVSKSSKLN